jgi:hypothetical protein
MKDEKEMEKKKEVVEVVEVVVVREKQVMKEEEEMEKKKVVVEVVVVREKQVEEDEEEKEEEEEGEEEVGYVWLLMKLICEDVLGCMEISQMIISNLMTGVLTMKELIQTKVEYSNYYYSNL